MTYFKIFISAVSISTGSVLFMKAVQDNDVMLTVFWEFVGTFLALYYNHSIIEEKTWKGRIILTTINAFGLSLGAAIAILIQ